MDKQIPEASPFSPPPLEKTLSPPFVDHGDTIDEQPKHSIAEALGQAQEIAVNDVAETMEQTVISEPVTRGPEVIFESPEDLSHHDARPEKDEIPGRDEMPPPPQIVLAPPNSAPPRPIPGPKWELERSPFLSDDENESDDAGEKANVEVAARNDLDQQDW